MITKKQIEDAGYEVLPQGGWIRISPENMPRDWDDVCSDFGVDPSCSEIILCVAGVKEVYEEEA
jgi:hypothetical protein